MNGGVANPAPHREFPVHMPMYPTDSRPPESPRVSCYPDLSLFLLLRIVTRIDEKIRETKTPVSVFVGNVERRTKYALSRTKSNN